ncbi:MAG: macro domain-containing protein [Pyrinomonadaceae bacterium]
MHKIEYRIGDATEPQGTGMKIITHCVNDVGAWGAGFVLALSQRWREPERKYRLWHQAGELDGVPFALGQVQFIKVASDIFVANLIGQRGIRHRGDHGLSPVRYEAMRQGLARVRQHAMTLKASVHMPRIGAGLAGGDWREIEQIICDELAAHDLAVTVYDLH